jgi:lipid-A-disaccharide synthase
MEEQGCPSLFPLSELAVMSLVDVLPRSAQHLAPYPAIGGRRDRAKSRRSRDPRQPGIHPSGGQARAPAGAANSDHRLCLAERLGLAAWPGAQDAPLRDHILAILPFEPEANRRLGGPACSYVGHPLVEKLDWMRNLDVEAVRERLGNKDRPCWWSCPEAGRAR